MNAPHPLTEAQSGLWYAQAAAPLNPLFNTGQYIELRGPLDVPAFEAALAQALSEAQALSLRMIDAEGGPQQLVDEAKRPVLVIIDLTGEPDPNAAAEADIARDMATPIDPTRGSLAGERLYRLSDQHFIWQQRIHHLAIDGYGMILLTQRIAELYNARLRGIEPGPTLPSFDVVLADDAAYRASPKRAADGDFWRESFNDRPDVASLVPGTPVSASTFHRRAVELDPAAFVALRELATSTNIPWPDVLTAITGAYVQRHTGTEEVILGVPHMGRLGSAAARVPAMLMNVLPLRLTPSQDIPLAEYLGAVARKLIRARRHGHYRSEQLRRDLKLIGGQRRLHGPLVNILPFDETPRFLGLEARLEVLSTGPVEDITFTFRLHGPDGLRLEVDSNPDLYSAEQTQAHALRLSAFVEAAVSAPTLAEIPTATPAETRRYLFDVNDTLHAVPNCTLVTILNDTLRHSPERCAIRFRGESVDYAALDSRSAALASQLAGMGIGRGDIVAIALPRSIELIVGLLGILRAGAAYLPLDLTHPDERLGRILASAKPRVALANSDDSHRLDRHLKVVTPTKWSLIPGAPPQPPEPEDAAYVIYTSGSTGEPKGVVIEHRAIANRLRWMREHYGFTAQDRILQKTPATFDVSVWEFFLPFITGATLIVAPPDAHRDPVALTVIIRQEAVTTAHFVPSMLAAFLNEPTAKGIKMGRVFCSGEELPADLRERFHRTISAELHNLYGPTEAAVDVSYWPATPDDRSIPVPIGFPVWNTRLYVLDDHNRPQPPGVAGHLYLAGAQLALGYLGRPDLTAERFVADPFVAGERMYKTGDLATYRPDGAVVYLGRSDHQIKIRGLRVELGEIEAAIMASGLVRQVVVIAREDQPGVRRLIAYVVPEGAAEIERLQGFVAARVPDYMVPSAFVTLDALPVTSNGKLDRAALPAPDFHSSGGRIAATPTERELATLFAAQLGIHREVLADDDFFALGGDSLQAVALLLRVREVWGRDPGLGALFAHPTVAGLAALIDSDAAMDDAGLEPLITLVEGDPALPPLFAIHPAGGISWCYGRLARTLTPRRTVYGLQAPALFVENPPPESMEALAADYVARIRRACHDGPYHLIGWSVGGIIAQAMAVRLQDLGTTVGVVAMLDSYPSDCWRAQAEPDEGAALTALLAIAGHDPDRLPALALTRQSVVAFLRATDSPLGTLPDAALDGVVRVVSGNNRLVRNHFHRFYDGAISYFRAALDHEGRDLSPTQWAPYAARIDVSDIASLHAFLTGHEATTAIAPLLARALGAADNKDTKPCATAASGARSPSSPAPAEA